MSAFFVSEWTLADAVQCMTEAGFGRPGLAQELWRMNAEALVQRYDDDRERFEVLISMYSDPEPSDNAYQVLKSTNCLIYQCSEGNVTETALFRELSTAVELYASQIGYPDRGTHPNDRHPDYRTAKWDRPDPSDALAARI